MVAADGGPAVDSLGLRGPEEGHGADRAHVYSQGDLLVMLTGVKRMERFHVRQERGTRGCVLSLAYLHRNFNLIHRNSSGMFTLMLAFGADPEPGFGRTICQLRGGVYLHRC